MPESFRCAFLTGATGYVGGRLCPRLLEAGWRVRCLVRSDKKLSSRSWTSDARVERVACDIQHVDDLAQAMRGCEVAYYLIHSMAAVGRDYARHDRDLALAFARAAKLAGVNRIIYLGGLGEMGDALSEHLSSRREVEACLMSTGVSVTVLRAAMIIGSGSASYEILRYLSERLPVMITPRWVTTECQPIAIRDVLRYLVQCANVAQTAGITLDIGGPDILTYRELIQLMARTLGLRPRIIVPVPLLTPRLSSLWIHLVTPLSYRVARPLADGLKNRVVCRDNRAAELMPGPLLSAGQAIERAAGKSQACEVETAWSDAGVIPGDPDWAGGKVFIDRRCVPVQAAPQIVFQAVCKLGGGHGYYSGNWLWRIRGWLDWCVGGPGLRRARRDPLHLAYGDALDFWRVTGFDPPRRLQLRAEMKLPGEALLEFQIEPAQPSPDATSAWPPIACTLVQTARFRPRGLAGLMYWYAVRPLHEYVFRGLLNGIRREAEHGQNSVPPVPP